MEVKSVLIGENNDDFWAQKPLERLMQPRTNSPVISAVEPIDHLSMSEASIS